MNVQIFDVFRGKYTRFILCPSVLSSAAISDYIVMSCLNDHD